MGANVQLLKSLWNRECVVLPQPPAGLQAYFEGFSLPLLWLCHRTLDSTAVHVAFEDELLAQDVALGDVLCEELGVNLVPGAVVVCVPCQARAQSDPFMVFAQVLYAVLMRQPEHDAAFFSWVLRSVTEARCVAGATEWADQPRAAIAALTGAPPQCDSAALDGYLATLSPGFPLGLPLALDLLERLMRARDVATFQLEAAAAAYAIPPIVAFGAEGVRHGVEKVSRIDKYL